MGKEEWKECLKSGMRVHMQSGLVATQSWNPTRNKLGAEFVFTAVCAVLAPRIVVSRYVHFYLLLSLT